MKKKKKKKVKKIKKKKLKKRTVKRKVLKKKRKRKNDDSGRSRRGSSGSRKRRAKNKRVDEVSNKDTALSHLRRKETTRMARGWGQRNRRSPAIVQKERQSERHRQSEKIGSGHASRQRAG